MPHSILCSQATLSSTLTIPNKDSKSLSQYEDAHLLWAKRLDFFCSDETEYISQSIWPRCHIIMSGKHHLHEDWRAQLAEAHRLTDLKFSTATTFRLENVTELKISIQLLRTCISHRACIVVMSSLARVRWQNARGSSPACDVNYQGTIEGVNLNIGTRTEIYKIQSS